MWATRSADRSNISGCHAVCNGLQPTGVVGMVPVRPLRRVQPREARATNAKLSMGVVSKHAANQLQPVRSVIAHGASSSDSPSTSDKGVQAILFFELEGAVVDMHMDGHREAFNKAFVSLGYDCVQWPMHVYHDLLTVGDGTPEQLITNYFKLCGWPTMLATSDQPGFVKQVHAAKQSALVKMLSAGSVPLRAGVKELIEASIADGAEVVFMTGTLSEDGDLVAQNALAQLAPGAAARVRVFSSGAVQQDTRYALRSLSDSDEEDTGTAAGAQEAEEAGASGGVRSAAAIGAVLRERQDTSRRQTAQAFVASFRAANDGGDTASLNVDPSLLARSRRVSPELLAAVAAALGVPLSGCIMLAASNTMTEAAAGAGMMAVAVPRKMAERGSFNGAKAKFSGFGAGECNWGRLKHSLGARI